MCVGAGKFIDVLMESGGSWLVMVVVVSYKAPWQLMTDRYLGTCHTYLICLGASLGTYQVGNSSAESRYCLPWDPLA